MEIFGALLGNEDIKRTLGVSISSSEFLHAYIIEGAPGTGKRTLARLASAAIMCKGTDALPCGICESCRKILDDNCADVRFIDAFKVDDVRKIKDGLYDSPTECPYKIYILNDVQKMNIKAQNALLISLEEPPPNVIFFLLTTNATSLLETIRSRAQLLRTKPLSNDEIYSYVRNNTDCALDDDSLNELIVSSGGALGYVLGMIDEKRAAELTKEREKALCFVTSLLKNDGDTVSLLASMFSWQRDKLKELFTSCLTVLRDLAVMKKSKSAPMLFFSSRDLAKELCAKYTLKRLVTTYELVARALDDLNTNAAVSSTLVSLITDSKRKGN